MQLERLPDAQAVAGRAADLVAETVRAKPEAVLLLPAGRTPVPLYAELVRRARAGALDLGRTRLFQLDELAGIGPGDARGFLSFFRQHLVQPLGLAARFSGIDGSARDPAAEIERHRRALAECGPADLVLLGLGPNGHVAFNEPGSELADPARVVTLGATTLAGLAHQFPNDCPRRGLTLGLAEIASGARLVMLVTGASKAEMLAHLLRGRASRERPATLLLGHPRFVVLADAAALWLGDPVRGGAKGSNPAPP
jgi:glucosamine-6-phosphate deaminase